MADRYGNTRPPGGSAQYEMELRKRNAAVKAFNATVDLMKICRDTGADTSQVNAYFKAMVTAMQNGDHDKVVSHQSYIFDIMAPQFPAMKHARITGMPIHRPEQVQAEPLPATTPPRIESGMKVEMFQVDEVFVVYNDGRLIEHASSKAMQAAAGTEACPARDDDIMSSMLLAIQQFIMESMGGGSPLGSFEYGNNKIMIHQGNWTFLAVVVSGKEPPGLRDVMVDVVRRFEGLYAGVIEEWNGVLETFSELCYLVRPLLHYHEQFVFEDIEEVRVLSAIEFYQGYVRLKVGIKNKTSTLISDSAITLTYDKTALLMSHVEPDYHHDGATVQIGNVQPGEKKTVAFFLDPLICMESFIDGTFIYRDYKGNLKNVIMKRRPADIVCPLFYTESNINAAMLKRLINEVQYRDSRAYAIPSDGSCVEAFGKVKHVVQRHHIQFVREFTEETPYVGEAWYYGTTDQTKEQMIIRVTAREDTRTIEVFVASSNLATMTGLLAELGNGVSRTLGSTTGPEKAKRVSDDNILEVLGRTNLLLDKYSEDEAVVEELDIDISELERDME